MTSKKLSSPQLFKGIALFTPGGDVVYSIDPDKQSRWHLHLCAALQEILDLPEPPHFLVPCYTATIDHWLDPRTQQIQTFAEAYPAVIRHQTLLNTIFSLNQIEWQVAPRHEGTCDRMVIATYRSSFPQLWADHDLIVRLDPSRIGAQYSSTGYDLEQKSMTIPGYVLRLFVTGHSVNTERILQNLHHLLERSLVFPYSLKVIDVLTHPEQAEMNQVSATPTLVKVWPHPIKRIVGKLDDTDKLLHILGVKPK